MHSQEAHDEAVWVLCDVLVVVRQDAGEELVLCLGLGLDHVAPVVGVEEELAGL